MSNIAKKAACWNRGLRYFRCVSPSLRTSVRSLDLYLAFVFPSRVDDLSATRESKMSDITGSRFSDSLDVCALQTLSETSESSRSHNYLTKIFVQFLLHLNLLFYIKRNEKLSRLSKVAMVFYLRKSRFRRHDCFTLWLSSPLLMLLSS